MDCNYPLPIALATNGSPFSPKSIEKVQWQSKYDLNQPDAGSVSQQHTTRAGSLAIAGNVCDMQPSHQHIHYYHPLYLIISINKCLHAIVAIQTSWTNIYTQRTILLGDIKLNSEQNC